MMLLLIRNIIKHVFQMLLGKTHHTIASLPLKRCTPKALIRFVRGSPLDLSDKFADQHKRFDLNYQMDMVFCSADTLKMHPFFFTAILIKKALNILLGFSAQKSPVSQTMPSRVKKNLAENMISSCHIDSPVEKLP